jgi:hypothetical protein
MIFSNQAVHTNWDKDNRPLIPHPFATEDFALLRVEEAGGAIGEEKETVDVHAGQILD